MKNQYGNIAGYHNPKMTEKFITELNEKSDLTFTCASWHNDLVDSASTEIGESIITIMLPNSETTNLEEEEFNFFTIIIDSGIDEMYSTNLKSLDDAIEFLSSNLK